MYKGLLLTLAAVAVLFGTSSTAVADPPVLDPGLTLNAGGGPIDHDIHFVPVSVDWNEDGAKDLLIGQYTNGHIHLLLNQGSDFDPVFATSVLVESAGSPITTTYG